MLQQRLIYHIGYRIKILLRALSAVKELAPSRIPYNGSAVAAVSSHGHPLIKPVICRNSILRNSFQRIDRSFIKRYFAYFNIYFRLYFL